MRAAALLAALVLGAPAAAHAVPADRTRPVERAASAQASEPRIDRERARAIAERVPEVREVLRRHPGWDPDVSRKGTDRWKVSFYAPPQRRGASEREEIAQVMVGARTGRVLEAWTGFRVRWTMGRGYDGAFGRSVNSPWIWVTLSVLFVLPFVDPRRPRRLLHLDLLVLSAFSVSLAFFNAAEVETSVPLVYPLLAYLLVRMLAIGLRRRAPAEPLRLLVPVAWLGVAAIFLLGFRIGLNFASSNVIDVGYSGVIGADRIADGDPLYGGWPSDNGHGDTYGPVAYAAYLPFEQIWPWSGRWDDLPAAHAAALTFDVLAMAALWLLGRRLRGPALGTVLAYAWAAFPFTLYAANNNSNDALVALLLVVTLLVAGAPAARGAMAALAGLVKFAPLALVPLLATHRWEGRVRHPAAFLAGFAAVAALALVPFVGDVGTFWERTLGFQATRDAPFSIWGLWDLGWPQRVVQVGAVLLAFAVAVVPRRRDVVGLAALGAAVLIALQLGGGYWFYLYLVWFFPLVMVALLARAPLEAPRAGAWTWRRAPVARARVPA